VGAASFFVLASPFLAFLKRYHYALLRADILLCLSVMAVVAGMIGLAARVSTRAAAIALALVMTLLIDAQFGVLRDGYALVAAFTGLWAGLTFFARYFTPALATGGAVMFVATAVLPASADGLRPPAERTSGATSLPLIVHIVLDAHIGLAGLQDVSGGDRLGDEIEVFFRRHRFQLFGSAYSEYFDTYRSLGHELNFSPGEHVAGLYSSDGNSHVWTLRRNAYFRDLIRDGYALTVYQSTFLDVCGDARARAACHTYDHTGIAALQSVPLSVADKASAILTIYAGRTRLYRELSFQYAKLQSRLAAFGIRMPIWQNRANTFSPLIALETMRRLKRDMATARRGDYVFAHLLLPHGPYVLDAGCNLLPPARWLTRIAAEAPRGAMNTADSRELRYERYAEQVRCVYRQLEGVLGAIPAEQRHDAIIIVQGDHGARITMTDPDPLPARTSALSPADFVDSYSTLFAVRAPKLAPGYDERMVSITCLLKALADADYENTLRLGSCSSEPEVFLSTASGKIEARQLPSFD